ncbi:MAG: DUF4126 domain-containing protein [Nitrospira sp.]|nr:DUF4126 domain-containing protein [bacterium]MBL7050194.1 DUF4126 domain-containing protein [Nitrospira sp.]
MDLLLSLLIGIGLSAACGYRVFVPLLGMSIAAITGHITLSPELQWLATTEVVTALFAATILEVGAYYIPMLDNLADLIATPTAVIAGTIVMSSFVADASPFMKWSLALIAGGGSAAIMQGSTVALRNASSAVTAGMGNFALSTVETVISVVLTVLSILIPVVSLIVVILIVMVLLTFWRRHRVL